MASFSMDCNDLLSALQAQDTEAAHNLVTLAGKHPHAPIRNAALLPSALEHVDARLTGLVLEVVTAAGTAQPMLCDEWTAAPSSTLVTKLIALVGGADLALADKAASAIEVLAVHASTAAESVLVAFWQAGDVHLRNNDMTLFLRHACTFARIVGRGGRLFALCDTLGVPARLVGLCQRGDDVLSTIVLIEHLAEFGKSSASLSFLVTSSGLDWLMATAAGADGLLATPAFHTVAEILSAAAARGLLQAADDVVVPRLVTRSFLPTAATFLDSRDDADRSVGIHALASFAVSNKQALARVMQDPALLTSFFAITNAGKADATAAVLLSVARILEAFNSGGGGGHGGMGAADEAKSASGVVTEDGGGADAEVAGMKQQLFLQLGKAKQTETVAFLIKTARMPVPETRLASHRLLAALVAQQPGGWGLREAFSNARGFREFLMDRTTEHNKEGKVNHECEE
jgi:hypothetical protein